MNALLPIVMLLLALVSCSGAAAPTAGAAAETKTPGPTAPLAPAPLPAAAKAAANPTPTMPAPDQNQPVPTTERATFANGCFWCTEAVLEQLPGVIDVVSGYTGGKVERPTYKQVCSGNTGHAECVEVTFEPAVIRYEALLAWFFKSHDPTTLNRQGADEGTQYRSAIFFHSAAQEAAARAAIKKAQSDFRDPIVTEVTAASRFWPAEQDHQDFFRNNPSQRYCRMVIAPKLQKLGLDAK